jgi:hypothetical protein
MTPIPPEERAAMRAHADAEVRAGGTLREWMVFGLRADADRVRLLDAVDTLEAENRGYVRELAALSNEHFLRQRDLEAEVARLREWQEEHKYDGMGEDL